MGAERQGGATISPLKATSITVEGDRLASVVSHRASIDLKPAELGLLPSGEPLTMGGGVREG